MLNIPPNFDLNQMTTRVKDQFMSQGFSVSAAMVSKNSSRIVLDKGCGGINMLLGMGQGITATCTINGNCLYVNYSDGDWTGKIIGLAVGWLLCLIPFITAIIGCCTQAGLPKKVSNEISMIVSSMQNVE